MNYFLSSLCCLLMGTYTLQAAASNDAYWQQRTDYEISVSLDDTKHQLNAIATITYTNYSPDELRFIWFHLWPNAYSSDKTAFARQKLENRQTDFYYAKASERGGIDQLAFKVGNTALATEADPNNPDIVKVLLAQPLKSGQSVVISTPFRVQIPQSVSRLGHVGQSYQLTQWYPKPAVYDQFGWHQMPYLDQGEFYSEYGSFDVSITLPQNYVVGATGDLQTESERLFLAQKVAETNAIIQDKGSFGSDLSFPASASGTKTLRYTQQNIHDFAWFADKRFHVLKEETKLVSGKKVDCWAMFTNQEAQLWQRGAEYIRRAVEFYSANVGEYPYQQATALQSALSAGSGMEYPNVTVIGLSGTAKDLDVVITHEVGHNWFYGQLGSNERAHAWMDEGINSYYEMRYVETYYPKPAKGAKSLRELLSNLVDLGSADGRYFAYLLSARRNQDQPIELPAAEYTGLNYGAIVYEKSALAMRSLERYLGTAKFDEVMKKYYRQYEFKHPQPADLRRIFEQETGKDLTWFFEQLIGSSAKIDYRITHVKPKAETIGNTTYDQITVKQGKSHRDAQGNPVGAFGDFTYVKSPFPISAVKDGEVLKTIWYDGFNGEAPLLFNHIDDYNQLVIDVADNLPDINRRNNVWRRKGLCHRGVPVRLKPIGGIANDDINPIYYAPAIAYNAHDRLMLGAVLYNSLLPNRTIEYALAPMYATGNRSFSGIGNVNINLYPKTQDTWWNKLKITLAASTFGSGTYKAYFKLDDVVPPQPLVSETAKYVRFSDIITLSLRPWSARSSVQQQLFYRDVWVWHRQFEPLDPALYNITVEGTRKNLYTAELGWRFSDRRVINPYSLRVGILSDFSKYSLLQTEANYRWSYKSKRKGFDMRFFGGLFLQNDTDAPRIMTLTDTPASDYFMDDLYIGRYVTDGVWYKQVATRQGGFKIPTPIGRSDKGLVAVNLKTNLPLPLLCLYADAGVPLMSDKNALFNGKLLYDAGLYLSIIPNTFEIYLPLVYANTFKDYFTSNNLKWYERISFKLNLKNLSPLETIRRAEF